MTTKHLIRVILSIILSGAVLAPALVLAQGASVTGSASITTGVVSASSTVKVSATFTKAQGRADTEITRRINALNDLNTRIQAMQEVTATFKTNLAANVQNQINVLTSLKAKIDADTDAATLKADVQSIATSYRIYILVLPQGRIAAAADREVAIAQMMTTLGSKLAARITAAQSAGQNVGSLTTALNDLAAKLQDASAQAQAAVSVSAPLSPDNGDATVKASNTAALKTARGDIKTSQQDLIAARADIKTIVSALLAMPSSASVSASSTTVAQ